MFNNAVVVDALWKITAKRKLKVTSLKCDLMRNQIGELTGVSPA